RACPGTCASSRKPDLFPCGRTGSGGSTRSGRHRSATWSAGWRRTAVSGKPASTAWKMRSRKNPKPLRKETPMSKPSESADLGAKIIFERTYRASVRELWDMWTTKEGFESWWAPEGLRVEVQTLEARLGGRFLYDMIADTPETIAAMEQLGLPPS